MGNDFVSDNLAGKGAVSVVIKDKNGNDKVRYDGPHPNTIGAVPLANIYALCFVGTTTGVGAKPLPVALTNMTTDPAEYTNVTKGGIFVLNDGGGKTLLAASSLNNTLTDTVITSRPWFPGTVLYSNSITLSASNSFYDNGTVSAFALAPNAGAIEQKSAFANHTPTAGTFAYSSGDTITVNWTVSFS